jgi:long-chain fatty acid transport protein
VSSALRRASRSSRSGRRTAAWLLGAALICAHGTAHGAGLYFSERGVRPLGRGGAFVAGGDDLGAVWYNPANVYDAKTQFLLDASWLNFTTDYTRRVVLEQRDPNTGEVVSRWERTFDPVEGTSPVIPIPTLVGSYQLHPEWVLALGAVAPYSAITTFPEEVNGEPAPSRYSLITLEGSALAVVGVWGAYAPKALDGKWRFGAGFEVLLGSFIATTMFSACLPERFFCAPEQPEWDSLTELNAGPIVAPSGNFGVTWLPHEQVRVGASFHLPFYVYSDAEVNARLPATPVFETASQEGSDATVSFWLPWSLRLGIEYSPVEVLALELDGAIEGWDIHNDITVTPNFALRDVVGFPNPFPLPEQKIPRNFQNAYSVRFGAEGKFPVDDVKLMPRAGVGYETSAIPAEYLTVLTVDIDKVTVAGGFGVGYEGWRFDAVYAYVFGPDVEVDPDDAAVPQLNPVEANVSEPHSVNGGTYSARAHVIGIGMAHTFDVPPAFGAEPEAKNDKPPAKPAKPKKAPPSKPEEPESDGDDDG